MSASANAPAIKIRQRAGEEMRRLREEAGFKTQSAAAEALGYTQQKISEIERGKRFPLDKQLVAVLNKYGASEEARGAVLALVNAARELRQQWWDDPKYEDLFTNEGRRTIELEDGAAVHDVFSGTYIPGLLQTPDYTAALVEFEMRDESLRHRELQCEARLERQKILRRDEPVLNAICLEAALRTLVGGPDVMRAQLSALLSAVKRERTTLRAIPFAATAGAVSAAFGIFTFDDPADKPVVTREMPFADSLADDAETLRQARRKFQAIEEDALSARETVKLIERIMEEL